MRAVTGPITRLRRGPVAGDLTRLARAERRAATTATVPGSSTLGNAEVSVLVSIDDTIAREDARWARHLLRDQRRLIAAAHASQVAYRRLRGAVADPRWAARPVQPPPDALSDAPEAETVTLDLPEVGGPVHGARSLAAVTRGAPADRGEPFDARQPLIRERTLAAVEFVFVVVEFFFWYNVFGTDVQPGAAWTDPTRISDLLLAALVPVSGIIAARVIGALGHRLVSGYPGLGRQVAAGTACATVLAALSLTAVYLLVHARFDTSTRPLGATPLPAVAMTLVFVVVLLGDMLARTFLLSEVRAQTRAWHGHLDRLLSRAAAANNAHAQAWTRLRTQVQTRLDRCERIVAAGARIIGDQRAVAGGWRPELPNPVWAPRPAHAPGGDAPLGPLAVPCTEQLQLYGAPLVLGPLRSVADAVDTLRHWPPYDQRGLAEFLDTMAARLYRLADPSRP